MPKKEVSKTKLTDKLTVKFNQDYVAARGAGIAGAKDSEAVYPWSPDLQKLIDEEIVSVVKTTSAADRKKAVSASAAKRETASG